jgi:hypothetical protein
VIDITFLLVLAGLDTVSASLSCIVDWFARNTDERQRVIDDPTCFRRRSRVMRVQTPVVAGGRYATADFEVGGELVRSATSCMSCGRRQPRRRELRRSAHVDFDRPRIDIAFAVVSTVVSARTWRARVAGGLTVLLNGSRTKLDPAWRRLQQRRDPKRRSVAGVHAPLTRSRYGSPQRSWYTTSSIGPRHPAEARSIPDRHDRSADVLGEPEDGVDLRRTSVWW